MSFTLTGRPPLRTPALNLFPHVRVLRSQSRPQTTTHHHSRPKERRRTRNIQSVSCPAGGRGQEWVKIHRSTDNPPTADLPPKADVPCNAAIRRICARNRPPLDQHAVARRNCPPISKHFGFGRRMAAGNLRAINRGSVSAGLPPPSPLPLHRCGGGPGREPSSTRRRAPGWRRRVQAAAAHRSPSSRGG
jgi:hypothetical protein